MTDSTAGTPEKIKRVTLSQAEVPALELERSIKLARALWDNFAGKSAKPFQLAMAIDMKPSSGRWRELTGASIAYALTDGGYNASEIRLTETGRRVVAPREEGDELHALRQAALGPRVCREFFKKYDGMKFPSDKIAVSILIDLGVPQERTDRVLAVLKANASYARLVHEIKGEKYVQLDLPLDGGARSTLPADPEGDPSEDESIDEVDRAETVPPIVPIAPVAPEQPRKIFVAHGRQRAALDAIKHVLERFKVPFVVAVDEPHAGRPISDKVAQLMKECTAGLFIFTPDEVFTNADGEKIYRPSENVIFELGAGSVLWGRKIVILKEKSVYFASDYRDIGYIEFSLDNAKSIGSDLLMELIALDFVKLQVG